MLSDCRAVAALPVTDLASVRSFYLDTLGLKPVEEREQEILLECGRGTAALVFVSTGAASGTHTQLAFECDDIRAEVDDLRRRGVVFEELDEPGFTSVDGIVDLGDELGAWFRDPAGNLLAIGQRLS